MILLIAALLAAEAAPAVTAPTPPPQPVVVTAQRPHYHDPLADDTLKENKASDDEVICHKSYVTGSRLNVNTVCLTKRHWAELQWEQGAYLDQQTAMKH